MFGHQAELEKDGRLYVAGGGGERERERGRESEKWWA